MHLLVAGLVSLYAIAGSILYVRQFRLSVARGWTTGDYVGAASCGLVLAALWGIAILFAVLP